MHKIVYGIKLFERECTKCTNKFWVPKSSKQIHCSEYCLDADKKTRQATYGRKIKRSKKGVKSTFTEEDYE